MPLLDLILLSLIQGITEFLPVSSSGHLVVLHSVLGHDDLGQSRILDIFVHLGTLLSVFVYLRHDILKMIGGVFAGNKGGQKLLGHLIIASIPVIIAGFILHAFEPEWLGSPLIVGITMGFFALVLWWADRSGGFDQKVDTMSSKQALIIGLAQILALIPGTSRAGITMTAARALGFDRKESARFSILLGAVAIAGAGTLGGIDLYQSINEGADITLGLDALIAFVLSFLSGWVAMIVMMRWLETASFKIFVIYRLVLAVVIYALILSGYLVSPVFW